MKKQEIGRKGEEAAAEYLDKEGYCILDKNYRAQTGEIDIIARSPNREYLVFVEVKTRRAAKMPKYGSPAEAVNTGKQRKIIDTALHYISDHMLDMADFSCRFDVFEIFIKDGAFEYNHIINAFEENQKKNIY